MIVRRWHADALCLTFYSRTTLPKILASNIALPENQEQGDFMYINNVQPSEDYFRRPIKNVSSGRPSTIDENMHLSGDELSPADA